MPEDSTFTCTMPKVTKTYEHPRNQHPVANTPRLNNRCPTPRQLATEDPQWDEDGDSLPSRIRYSNYTFGNNDQHNSDLFAPRSYLNPELDTLAANLTQLEEQQDQLEQPAQAAAEASSHNRTTSRGAGRGRGFARGRTTDKPGLHSNDRVREEALLREEADEFADAEPVNAVPADNDAHLEHIEPEIAQMAIDTDAENADAGSRVIADEENAVFRTLKSVLLQLGVALLCLTIAAGPSMWVNLYRKLHLYSWLFTWFCWGLFALIAAKLVLSLAYRFCRYCFGASFVASLAYSLCPGMFHKYLTDSRLTPAGEQRPHIANLTYTCNIPRPQRRSDEVRPDARRTGGYHPEHAARREVPDNSMEEEPRVPSRAQGSDFGQTGGPGESSRNIQGDRRGRDPERRSSDSRIPSYLRQSGAASGGWNGEELSASTPANVQPTASRRRTLNPGRNFRASSAYGELGSNRGIVIREDRNLTHRYDSTFFSELSLHDQEVVNDCVNSSAYAHNIKFPEFDGKFENYAPFRRDFFSMLPGILPRLRLTTLRNALLSKDSKRIIEDFEDTDKETFCAAILALDQEYNDITENTQRLLEEVRKLTQTHYKSDDDFVSKLADITSYLKRLCKIDPNSRFALEQLSKPWLEYVPDPIFNKAKRCLGSDKAWLTFDNIFYLCEEYARSVKHSRSLSESRARAQRTAPKGTTFNTYASETLDTSVPPPTEETEEFDVNFVRRRGLNKPEHLCCFCKSNQHHSTVCNASLTAQDKFNAIFKSSNVRCLLCLEEGHHVGWCPLIRTQVPYQFKCDICVSKPTHAKIICEIVKPKPNPDI